MKIEAYEIVKQIPERDLIGFTANLLNRDSVAFAIETRTADRINIYLDIILTILRALLAKRRKRDLRQSLS
jgi:hypothetical protein